MSRRKYNPLEAIPSASILREHLSQLEEEARRVRVVLRTAEEIEREQQHSKSTPQAEGVAAG